MSQSEVFQAATNHPPNRARLRLDYLDGLRGLAAIYVVVYHIYVDMSAQLQTVAHSSVWVTLVQAVLSHGRTSVAAFIVLSGYCLMLPVARSPDGQLTGGWVRYLRRRARRILPPYYAALVLSLLVAIVIPTHWLPLMGEQWNHGQPALNPGAIVSHVLLLHNWSHTWEYRINPPMWSVALEWQIYFLFPLLLLPIWRRLGTVAVTAIACAVPLLVRVLLHNSGGNALVYVALFTLGMAGAAIGFSPQPTLQRYRTTVPWNPLALLWVALWLVLVSSDTIDVTTVDQLVGPAVVCLIIACSAARTDGNVNPCLRLFEWRWATRVGAFSYSLYLTHALVLGVVELCLSGLSLSPLVKLVVLIAIVVPSAIGFAYLFHVLFERRFLSHAPAKQVSEPIK